MRTTRQEATDMDAGYRQTNLPDGGTLEVRPVRRSDIPELRRLHESLSLDDRHTRFFSAYRPTEKFIEDLTRAEEAGGYRLVAVVTGPAADAQLVAEAGYVALADGDGELDIVVEEGWRGWLGAYLLDALLEVAAARGVPNLQAEVLLENRRMLSLLRRRGYVTLGHDGWSSVRATVSTTGGVPTWPARGEGPRVLVEVSGAHWNAEDAAHDAGLSIAACPGPDAGGTRRCPVLDGEPCPLAADADVIVFALRAGDPSSKAVLEGHTRLHPEVPVCVEVLGDEAQQLEIPGDMPVLRRGARPQAVLEVLSRLLLPRAGSRTLSSTPPMP